MSAAGPGARATAEAPAGTAGARVAWRRQVLSADLGPGVTAVFTTAAAGNLGRHVGDDPDRVAAHRQALTERVGVPVVFGRQVHGTRVLVLDPAGGGEPVAPADAARADADTGPDPSQGVDGLVATSPSVAPGVLVADCVPVLLADVRAGVVAAAHAGRVGLLDGVLGEVVAAMVAAGALPERLRAVLGPSAGPCCYEVPAAMVAQAADRLPATAARTTWGSPALDLRSGCRQALQGCGVSSVLTVGGCTVHDPTWFSHRRAAGRPTGRLAGVVRLLP